MAPSIRSELTAPATDVRLHMAQMQILQPLPRHTVPDVTPLRSRGRPESDPPMATPCPTRIYHRGKPFALSYNRLMDTALLLRKYLPHMESFGMFARVTDITPKSVEELRNLHHLKLDSINIGMETAHDPTLDRMDKGYHSADILEQLSKLDEAGIHYNVFYLNGLGGQGNGVASAAATAEVLNRLHPCIINIVSLTIFPESRLHQDVIDGTYQEAPEIERLVEMRTLIERLTIKTNLLGHHISNTIPITGALPYDKAALLSEFDKAISSFPEQELRAYRKNIRHL